METMTFERIRLSATHIDADILFMFMYVGFIILPSAFLYQFVYQAVARPTLLYGCETWPMSVRY